MFLSSTSELEVVLTIFFIIDTSAHIDIFLVLVGILQLGFYKGF